MFGRVWRGELRRGHGHGVPWQANVDALLNKVRRKYKEYGIHESRSWWSEADNGTYGMGIMTVRDVRELDPLNRRRKTRWRSSRTARRCPRRHHPGGRADHERMNDAVAEPVVYMMDRYVVGASTASMPSAASMRTSSTRARASCRWLFDRARTCPAGRQSRRERAQPLLHVRRDRAPGDAGGQLQLKPPTRTRKPSPDRLQTAQLLRRNNHGPRRAEAASPWPGGRRK